jgi:hypothetical protein
VVEADASRTWFLAGTLLAGLVLLARRGMRGALLGGALFLAAGSLTGAPPLLHRMRAALELLRVWDLDNLRGLAPEREPPRVVVPLELARLPWSLREGEIRTSRRIDLPPGVYSFVPEVTSWVGSGRGSGQVDLRADAIPVVGGVGAGLSGPLGFVLPVGARRLALVAKGPLGLRGAEIQVQQVVPRSRRTEFPWPRFAGAESYRMADGGVFATALDDSTWTRDSFSMGAGKARFVLDTGALEVRVLISRDAPAVGDLLTWAGRTEPLGPMVETALELPTTLGLRLGDITLIPVSLASGSPARITFLPVLPSSTQAEKRKGPR